MCVFFHATAHTVTYISRHYFSNTEV